MSFRLRVLALVVLVGVTATAATAWLTLREASQQISSSSHADAATQRTIVDSVTEYGRSHGTWEGVSTLVADLTVQLGVRIQLVTTHGDVLVDSDHLSGQGARPAASLPILVDPRPTLELDPPEAPVGQDSSGEELTGSAPPVDDLVEAAYTALTTYRYEVYRTACLARAAVEVRPAGSTFGVVRYQPVVVESTPEPVLLRCTAAGAELRDAPLNDEFEPCRALPDATAARACLQERFTNTVGRFAPVPLQLYLGAVGTGGPLPLEPGPVLVAAALVAVCAIGGTLLLSRRVLRPIGALTGAAGRLGAGDLTGRVPVSGNDELAALARAFNQMADSLQRGEERQRRLVADVAHELRTPLANLRGYLEALKDKVVAPDPELFESLHEEALLQQRLVDDLQDLALAEAGTLVYHRVPVDLSELLETCRAAHQAAADATGVRLVVTAPEPVPVTAADPDRLRQVFGNLISNAVRATAAGGEVRLTAGRAGDQAVVTVADTGFGISPVDLPHVFDRFWRADAARGRGTGGSGLGLAIARQLVADHRGTITVDSGLGAGATFTVAIPVLTEPS